MFQVGRSAPIKSGNHHVSTGGWCSGSQQGAPSLERGGPTYFASDSGRLASGNRSEIHGSNGNDGRIACGMVASWSTTFYFPAFFMTRVLVVLIRVYQWTLSPLLQAICGPGCGCRFEPSCSRYFIEALETHGLCQGVRLGIGRILRCQPWGGCGHDPVPAPFKPFSN